MRKLMLLSALALVLSIPAMARQELYRWTDPVTGQIVTTPTPPPYPIKNKRPGGTMPGVDMYNVELDENAPQVKAAITKRQAAENQEHQKQQEKALRKAAQDAKDRERILMEIEQDSKRRAAREEKCNGPLSFGVKIGMTTEDLMLCLQDINNGHPDRVNTTTTARGMREQWVYRFSDEDRYYYFENGVLTTIHQQR